MKKRAPRPDRPPARFTASALNPEFPYELRIKFSGPAPNHPELVRLVDQVLRINRCGEATTRHQETVILLGMLRLREVGLTITRTTTTLEVPEAAYHRVKPKRRG